MARVSKEVLIRVLAGISGLIVAVVLTGCGEVGELGSGGDETTTTAPDEQSEEGRTGDPPAVRDTEEETSDTTDEWTEEEEEEAPAEPTDEWIEEEEPNSESTDEGEPEEEAAPDDFTGGDTESDEDADDSEDGDEGDESSGEAHTYSGSGATVTETAHLEGDYTVTFSVSDNLLMDMESNFIAFLTNVDDEFDFWMLVNDIVTETSGTTNVYGLDGDYYIDVMADGDWSFEFTPQ